MDNQKSSQAALQWLLQELPLLCQETRAFSGHEIQIILLHFFKAGHKELLVHGGGSSRYIFHALFSTL